MTVIKNIKIFYQRLFLQNDEAKYSLAFFRIAFGLLMFGSTLRFVLKGWIEEFYINPSFHFPFYGFEFIQPFSGQGMYIVFSILLLSTVLITLGLFYRISIITYFLLFTYVELIDKTYYLNHYYFVTLISFLLIFLPMNQSASLDKKLKLVRPKPIYNFYLFVIMLQVGLVYFLAGVAKLKYDWLFEAQPLKIWLSSFSSLPMVGFLLEKNWVAYLGSWFGAFFDLLIPFVLLHKKWRFYGYVLVIIFHTLTYFLFYIGMFPFIMMVSALIFFETSTHKKILNLLGIITNTSTQSTAQKTNGVVYLMPLMAVFFLFQILMPFRYLLYGGNIFYHEQGYRFSWNVMLMEKTGYCDFSIHNVTKNTSYEVSPYSLLTKQQARMMSTQPDMILQFAKHLHDVEKDNGNQVEVFANCNVSINGKENEVLINPKINLAEQEDGFRNKSWILSNYK